MTSHFSFDEQREQSAIKTEIVTKYFDAWARILSNHCSKIAYIDLFAGPGIYEDGTVSTPILIIQKIISSELLRKKTVVCLNEKDKHNYDALVKNIHNIENITSLTFKPKVTNDEVNYNTPKNFMFNKIPCFCFIDPAGYNGLSLDLLKAFGKDYGSDIIFFFNYNDINRAISNTKVLENMKQLFGDNHFSTLKDTLKTTHGHERESVIMNEMSEAIKDIGMNYVLPFRFKTEGKNRTSHYIIFASKNITGFNIMKDIMYKIGEKDFNGIGQFEFIPSCDKNETKQLSIIDLFSTPFEDFKNNLCSRYAGQVLTMKQLYLLDSPNTRFVSKQYKQALKELEEDGYITCDKPYTQRRKGTFADHTTIYF